MSQSAYTQLWRKPHCRIGAIRIKHKRGWGAVTRNRLKKQITIHTQLAQELGRGEWRNG